MTPTQTMHYYMGKFPKIFHTFALFDLPKMGNLMTPIEQYFYSSSMFFPQSSSSTWTWKGRRRFHAAADGKTSEPSAGVWGLSLPLCFWGEIWWDFCEFNLTWFVQYEYKVNIELTPPTKQRHLQGGGSSWEYCSFPPPLVSQSCPKIPANWTAQFWQCVSPRKSSTLMEMILILLAAELSSRIFTSSPVRDPYIFRTLKDLEGGLSFISFCNPVTYA